MVWVPVGYKNLAQVGELGPVLDHMAQFLCPAFQALDNASLYSGVVVGLKFEVVVCVCLLPEYRHEGVLPFLSTSTSRNAILLPASSAIMH